MRDKAETSGYITLFLGIGLLAFTFLSAYLFLRSNASILGSPDLVTVFGEALAPLIETCIRIMYLGVMGWIGSLLTVRGVQLVTRLPRATEPAVQNVVTPLNSRTWAIPNESKIPNTRTGNIVKDGQVETAQHSS